MEVLLGNVHRKGHGGVCCRDAVHDGGQGAHAPLLRRVGGTQEICKHTQAAWFNTNWAFPGGVDACVRRSPSLL